MNLSSHTSRILLLAILCCFVTSIWGQKNNPVAGHAATLLDLTQKDYSGIPLDRRIETISKDRTEFRTILQSYMTSEEEETRCTCASKDVANGAEKAKGEDEESKKKYDRIKNHHAVLVESLASFLNEDVRVEFSENQSRSNIDKKVQPWAESFQSEIIVFGEKLQKWKTNFPDLTKNEKGEAALNQIESDLSKWMISIYHNNELELKKAQTILNAKRDSFSKAEIDIAFEKEEGLKTLLFNIQKIQDLQSLRGLELQFACNHFLKKSLETYIDQHSEIGISGFNPNASSNASNGIQKSLAGVDGGLSLTTVIDGFSQFLAERIKKELTIGVFEYVQKIIDEEKINGNRIQGMSELKILLPQTTNYLLQFEADQMISFSDEMKQFIEVDLNNLLENLPNLREADSAKELLKKKPDLALVFDGLEIVHRIKELENPIDFFDIIADAQTLKKWNALGGSAALTKDEALRYNISEAFEFINLMANSMTIIENGERRFVSKEFVNHYGGQLAFYQLYIGLLRQQDCKHFRIKFGNENEQLNASASTLQHAFVKLMSKKGADLLNEKDRIADQLSEMAEQTEVVFEMARDIRSSERQETGVNVEDIHNFIDGLADLSGVLMESTILFADVAEQTELKLRLETTEEKVESFQEAIKTANDILVDLGNERYASALLKGVNFVYSSRLEVLNKSDQIAQTKAKNANEAIQNTYSFVRLGTDIPPRITCNAKNFKHHLHGLTVKPEIEDAYKSKFKLWKEALNDAIKDKGTDAKDASDDALEDFLDVFSISNSIPKTNSKVIALINFMNEMAKSENAEDVKAAIEAFALPVGSYRIHRESALSVSLATYPGLSFGNQVVLRKNDENANNSGYFSFTAPVGVNVAWGSPRLERKWSYSLFFSLVDVGAVTAFRFNSDNSEAVLPEISFENIFAPGLHMYWGLPKAPLAFGVFAQYGPSLRNVSTEGLEINSQTMRFGINFTVDIPIWNVYAKPFKK